MEIDTDMLAGSASLTRRHEESRTEIWSESTDAVGEMIIPAYVTSRTIPGVVSVFHGGMYQPGGAKTELMPDGIDRGGNQNFLIEDTQPGRMRIGPTLDAGLCQVEKL